jgi:hypothetical protein
MDNTEWDGNINTPHTMQDEYELARSLGTDRLTTDDRGQMIAADDEESRIPSGIAIRYTEED